MTEGVNKTRTSLLTALARTGQHSALRRSTPSRDSRWTGLESFRFPGASLDHSILGATMRPRSHNIFSRNQFFALLIFFLLSAGGHADATTSITFVGAGGLADVSYPVSSVSIKVPSGVQAGDCLIAQLADYDGDGSDVPRPPSGWTLIRHDSISSGGDLLTSWLYYKVASASEPKSYKWNLNFEWVAGAMAAWRGASSSPIDVTTGSAVSGDEPLTAGPPSSSPSYGNELRLVFYASQDVAAPLISLPGTLSQRLNAGSSKEGFTLAFADVDASVTGLDYSATVTGSSLLTAQSILIVPAQAGGPTGTVSLTPTPTVPPRTPTPTATATPLATPIATPTAPPGGSTSGIEFIAASSLSDYAPTGQQRGDRTTQRRPSG